MARNLQLALTLLAKDTASKVLQKVMQDTVKQTKASEKAGDELSKSQQQNASTGIKASRSLQDEYRRAASARATVGIRSERDIQREILQTQAAYSRLVRTGTLSVNEQTRAFRAMKSQVRELNIEMRGFSRLERAKGWGSNTMAIAGGVTAAGAVIAQPVKNQMSYERRLADMANTAFEDQGVDGRLSGMKGMDKLIRTSVMAGGGTKESAADTLNTLLASGTVDMDSASTLLPLLQRYSTATGAAPTDLAQIAIRLKQTFGIKDNDVEKALNMSISAGQGGSFELADMAKWLPQQLAAASNIGMKGLDDFAVLLSANQAAAITAGTSDEAGNNVVNLLAKINSQDAANSAAKIKLPSGNGIDLPNSLVAAQNKGINSLDAFIGIIDKVANANPKFKQLEAKLSSATGDDRRKILESQASILEGSAVGQVIADRQALMALLGYRGNKKYADGIKEKANIQRTLPSGKTAGDVNFAVMASTPDFKSSQFSNVREFSEIDSIKPLSDVLGNLSTSLVDYSKEYPELTVAISGATTGIKAMTAAAMVFAGIRFLGGAGGMGGVAGPKGPISIPGMSGAGGIGLSVAALSITAGSVAIKTTQDYLRQEFAQKSMPEKVESLKSGTSGYSFVDVAWEVIKNRLSGNSKPSGGISMPSVNHDGDINPFPAMEKNIQNYGVPAYLQKPANGNGQPTQPIQLNTKIELDGRVLAESVNNYNGNQSSRGPMGVPQ